MKNNKNIRLTGFFIATVFVLVFFLFNTNEIKAQTSEAENLRIKIDERNALIKNLENEIVLIQADINKTAGESQSLSNEIKSLDLAIKKLGKDITLSENKIAVINDNIKDLSFEIKNKQNIVISHLEAIKKLISNKNMEENQSLIEVLFSDGTTGDIWNKISSAEAVSLKIKDRIAELKLIEKNLSDKKDTEKELLAKQIILKQNLRDQKTLITSNINNKKTLLLETKNKETNYKKLLDQRIAKKTEFERDLYDLESSLQFAIDPSKLPKTGSGVLNWPLDFVKITQFFGNTTFASKNSALYNGKGHNGIDLRAAIGTPVKSARGGIVKGTGNTDLENGCYSYGKWVMVEHDNGISTLYSHLSLISVQSDQKVGAGQILGYSGNTGASTGPHLHFSVYATQGVKIMKYTKSLHCKNTFIPMADFKAYLNPLSYL